MKKIAILLILVFGWTLCGHSQTDSPKNQISVFYGIPSAYYLVWSQEESADEAGTRYMTEKGHYTGVLNLQYMRSSKIIPKLEIGLAANYEKIDGLMYDEFLEKSWTEECQILRVISVAQYNAFATRRFHAYVKGGIGINISRRNDCADFSGNIDDDLLILPCVVVAVGAEYGSWFLRPFAEIGFSSQGIASAGLRARF